MVTRDENQLSLGFLNARQVPASEVRRGAGGTGQVSGLSSASGAVGIIVRRPVATPLGIHPGVLGME